MLKIVTPMVLPNFDKFLFEFGDCLKKGTVDLLRRSPFRSPGGQAGFSGRWEKIGTELFYGINNDVDDVDDDDDDDDDDDARDRETLRIACQWLGVIL